MRRCNSLPGLFTVVFLLVLSVPLRGQNVSVMSDSLRSDSLELIPYTLLPIEECGLFLVPPGELFLLVRDSATFAELVESKRFIGQCRDMQIPQIDYARHAVFGFDLFVDCNADVEFHLVRDTLLPGYLVLVDTRYGGCRSMRSYTYWLQIPALKDGESVRMEERRHEDY